MYGFLVEEFGDTGVMQWRKLAALRPGPRQVCFNLNIGVRNLSLMSMSISTSERFLTYTLPRFREVALPLFAAGAFKAPVGPVLPLSEVARAHELIGERNHFGKIILTVDE